LIDISRASKPQPDIPFRIRPLLRLNLLVARNFGIQRSSRSGTTIRPVTTYSNRIARNARLSRRLLLTRSRSPRTPGYHPLLAIFRYPIPDPAAFFCNDAAARISPRLPPPSRPGPGCRPCLGAILLCPQDSLPHYRKRHDVRRAVSGQGKWRSRSQIRLRTLRISCAFRGADSSRERTKEGEKIEQLGQQRLRDFKSRTLRAAPHRAMRLVRSLFDCLRLFTTYFVNAENYSKRRWKAPLFVNIT